MPQGERFAYSFPIKVLTAPAGQPNSSDRTGGRFKNYNMRFSPCQEEMKLPFAHRNQHRAWPGS